mgnify:CR=1 FL=1
MANENSNVVVDRAQSHWSDLWKKEDYWAIWLGFALLIAAICIFINGAPASYKETIDKSNAIMKVEAEKAPFKTIAYIQAQDAKKGVVGTNLPIAKEIKAFIASPGKWTDNPVKSMFTSQAEADAAAEAAKNAAIGQLQNEAQGMVDAAIASARAQLANIAFSYDEITIPHGFDSTPGALGSHQTITVPANSSNDYKMQNDEWSVKVSIDKIDSETKQRIKGDAEFKIFAWDTVRQCYIPNGGYNQYKVERQSNGIYKVINHSNYANGSDNIYYAQRNEGKFVIVESRAPSGYYGDWSDVNAPGTAGSVLGKRAYAFEITKALDGQTIWLGNADYNADISTTNSGGTLIDTGEGVVTITFGSRNADNVAHLLNYLLLPFRANRGQQDPKRLLPIILL